MRSEKQLEDFALSGIAAGIVLVMMSLCLGGCGSGGGSDHAPPSAATATQGPAPGNVLEITRDDYGLIKPDFYYSTNNEAFWSVQANVARSVYDPDSLCVLRIDIPKSGQHDVGALKGHTFALHNDPVLPAFPGSFLVLNGHESVRNRVEAGTVTFDAPLAADVFTGSFDIYLTDYASHVTPLPRYRIQGTFGFRMGSYGQATPRPESVFPVTGQIAYDTLCAGCHSLGQYDGKGESAGDLSQRGGDLSALYPGAGPHHEKIQVSGQTLQDLKVFLNAK